MIFTKFTWSQQKLATPVVSLSKEDDPTFLILEGECSGQVDQGPQSNITAQQGEGAEHNAWGLINYQVGIGYPVGLKHKKEKFHSLSMPIIRSMLTFRDSLLSSE